MSSALRAAVIAVALLPGLGPSSGARAEAVVRVATWHLAGVPGFVPSPPASPVWRHTFGPRRESARASQPRPARFEADVVALQGVPDVRLVRSYFPAAEYHLLWGHSRTRATAARSPIGFAIRRQTSLRVTGREFLLPAAGDPFTGAFAIRIAVDGRALWLLSVDAGPPCASAAEAEEPPCRAARRALSQWLDRHAASEEVALVAGRIPPLPQPELSPAPRAPGAALPRPADDRATVALRRRGPDAPDSAASGSPPAQPLLPPPPRGKPSPDAESAAVAPAPSAASVTSDSTRCGGRDHIVARWPRHQSASARSAWLAVGPEPAPGAPRSCALILDVGL